MPTAPQDHKPAKGAPFKFKAGNKTFTLPSAEKGRSALTGRDLRDAAVGGDIGQLGYLIKAFEAAEPTPEALNALYDMPQDKMLEVLSAWGDYGDGDGASLGE